MHGREDEDMPDGATKVEMLSTVMMGYRRRSTVDAISLDQNAYQIGPLEIDEMS